MSNEKIIENLKIAVDICDSTPHEHKEEVMDSIEEAINIISNLEDN